MATEQRLIDANALWDEVDKSKHDNPHTIARVKLNHRQEHDHFLNMIFNAPTVDAVEVVHGRWEDVQETEMYVPDMKFTITKTAETCSVCKARIGFVGGKRYLFDAICPNCGAKMDGKENQ